MSFLAKLKHLGKQLGLRRLVSKKYPSNYPVQIVLPGRDGPLSFEAGSPVEYYRIAEYGGERAFLDYFLDSLQADDIVFDIGASVGLVTVHAATVTNLGEIVAFEPDPETFSRLEHNLQLNKLSNVKAIPWAMGDVEGEVTLFSEGVSGFAPTLREQSGRPGAPKSRVKVPIRTLDQAILDGDVPLPTVLKVDIEGAEALCLKGAQRLLSGEMGVVPRLIFLELHPDFLPSFDSSVDEIHNLVLSNGYTSIWQQKRDAQIHYTYQRK